MSTTDFDPDAYLAAPPAASTPVKPPAASTTLPPSQDFNPDAYLANKTATTGFDPDAYLKGPVEPTPHQAYRASTKALSTGSPEQPAGVGVPQPTDFTSEMVSAAELAKQWGDVAYGVPKGLAAFPAGGFLGDTESMGRHLIGANPETYFPTTVEGGYLGPKGAGLINPAATPEEAIGMSVGAMLLPGPKMLRAIKGERPPAVPPAMPPGLLPERSPLGVTLTEGELLNDPVKRAAEQRLIRQQDPHAQKFVEQRSAQLAQAPLEAAPQLDPLGQVQSGSSIQAADSVTNALDQHQDLVNQQLQSNTNLLAAAHEDFHNKLSPTGTSLAQDPMEAADVIQGAVDNESQRAIAAKNQAYKALEDSDVVFHPAAFNNAGNKMRALVDKADKIDINPETTPIANQAINNADSILSSLVQKRDDAGQILPNEPITPGVLEDVRKRLNVFMGQAKAAAQAGKPSDAIAMRSVLDAFDDLVEDRVAKGTVTQGNPLDALSQMRYARGLNTAYRKAFTPQGPGDVVGQAIQKIIGRYDGQAATPEQIQGMMYTPKNPLSVKIANRFKNMFGETSSEFGAAKQGFNSFLTQRPPGGAAWGPEQVADRIDQYTKGPGRTLTQAYLSPQEINRLQTLGKASRQHASDLEAGENPFEGVDWQTTFRQAVNGSQKAVGNIDEALTRVGPTSPTGSTVRQGLFFNALQPVQGVEKWGFKQKADNLASLLQSTRNSAVYGPEHRQVIQSYIDLLRKLETSKSIFEPSGPAVDRLKLGIERGVGQLIGYAIARHIPGAGLAMDLIGMRLGGEGASFLARRNANKIRVQLPIVADEMQKWQRAQARAAKNPNWATNQGAHVASVGLQKSLAPLGIDFNKLRLSGGSTPSINFNNLQLPGGVAAEPNQQPQQRADGGATENTPPEGYYDNRLHLTITPPSPDVDQSASLGKATGDPLAVPSADAVGSATKPFNDALPTPGGANPPPAGGVETPVDTFLARNPSPSPATPQKAPADVPTDWSTAGFGPSVDTSEGLGSKVLNKLTGAGGEERYQTWPEKMIRSGTTLAGDVLSGQEPDLTGLRREDFTDEPRPGGFTVAAEPQDSLIQRTQDMAALAGGVGIPSAEEGALGMAGGKLLQPNVAPKPFYSTVENAIASAPQQRMQASQWAGWLKNQPGVKGEELEHLGLNDPSTLPTDVKGMVNKGDLLQHVQGNGVGLKEVEKVDGAGEPKHFDELNRNEVAKIEEKYREHYGESPDDPEELETFYNHNVNESSTLTNNATKFSDYQLPGGENYREMLLTMPKKENVGRNYKVVKHPTKEGFALRDQNGNYSVQDQYGPEPGAARSWPTLERAQEGVRFYTHPARNDTVNFTSSHWDEPNVLAHMRMNDRDIPGVGKSLHLEELQSDWAQKGRKEGFRGKTIEDPKELKQAADEAHEKLTGLMRSQSFPEMPRLEQIEHRINELENSPAARQNVAGPELDEYNKLLKERATIFKNEGRPNYTAEDRVGDLLGAVDADQLSSLKFTPTKEQIAAAEDYWDKYNKYREMTMAGKSGVPNMPFKTTWPDLLLKRAITKAAREGKNAISWTPGEQQAARYDLSKQVSRLQYHPDTNDLIVEGTNGRTILDKKVEPKDLPDMIGKEAADRVLNNPTRKTIEPAYKVESKHQNGGLLPAKLFADKGEAEAFAKQRGQQIIELNGPNKGMPVHHLEGLDLKVGGEGMKSFYDKMLVDKANAIGKKYGAKVEWKPLHGDMKIRGSQPNMSVEDSAGRVLKMFTHKKDAQDFVAQGGLKVPVLRLTPQLKEQAISKGMPLFSDTAKPGAALSGVEKVKQVADAGQGTRSVPVSGKFKAAASYKDSKGYTVTIKAYKKPNDQHGPQGEIHLTNPTGKSVESISNWMDYPEPGWKYKGVDVYKDWKKHEKSGIGNSSIWRTKVPLDTRLRMEAKQQGIPGGDYSPLKDQYKEYKEHEKGLKEDADYKPMTEAELHKYLADEEKLPEPSWLKKYPNLGGKASGGAVNTRPNQQQVPRPIAQEPHSGQPAQEQARAQGGRVNPANINHAPSDAQKASGSYAKDHVNIHGLNITVENARGSIRRGVDKTGKAWECQLPCAYGYFKRSEGKDGDHVDVFLGPHLKSNHVYLIDQVKDDTKKYDEAKVFVGFGNQQQAVNYYKRAFSDGKGQARIGAIHSMAVGELKLWLTHGDTKAPFKPPQVKKLSHTEVSYEPRAKNMDNRCFNCVHFVPARHGGPECILVTSPISPQGWCPRFRRKRL